MKSVLKEITEADLNRQRKWYKEDMELYRKAKPRSWDAGYWYGVSRVRMTIIEEMEIRLRIGHEKTASTKAVV